VKLVWLVSVPVIALAALFAVKSAPTLAGPGCAAECAGVTADQSLIGVPTTTYASGASIYQQVSGQYCSDKTGGLIYVASGAPTPAGLTCPAGSASATATATKAATSTATSGAASTATSTATRAATASATASAAGTASPTATAGR
jgi:hypothetical protein